MSKSWYQEKSGKTSSMRVMSMISLIVSFIFSSLILFNEQVQVWQVCTNINSGYLVTIFVLAAFAPKALQKIYEGKREKFHLSKGSSVFTDNRGVLSISRIGGMFALFLSIGLGLIFLFDTKECDNLSGFYITLFFLTSAFAPKLVGGSVEAKKEENGTS